MKKPKFRCGTKKAIDAIAKELDLLNDTSMQDWAYIAAEAKDLGKYITHYNLATDEDEKFVLMEMIIQTTDRQNQDGFLEYWHTIELLLRKDFDLHAYTIHYWCCFDAESTDGFFYNTPSMRALWFDVKSKMSPKQFTQFWAKSYPKTVPIPHFFKYDYANRWFRIHSLPDSKRYAETDAEWAILLERQKTLITDLFGEVERVILVTGTYKWKNERRVHVVKKDPILKTYPFKILPEMDLPASKSEYYDAGMAYRPAFAEALWQSEEFDNLLRGIANDELRVFFVSMNKNVIIAPYDGGVDVILKDIETKNAFKIKYKDWLSEREDGF